MARTFLLLGSGEFEPWTAEVEQRALAGSTGDGSVAILPTASAPEGDEVFDRWGTMGVSHYEGMGVPAEILPLKTREDAMRDDLAARVETASMVFFSGGKPQHLAKVLDGTPFLTAVLRVIERGGVYAGCSAGAMVASRASARGDGRRGTSWVFGLGIVESVSFGVHWDRVKWIPGLRPFVMTRVPPGSWFVGIDERTAILGDGVRWDVEGRATVTVRRDRDTKIYLAGDRFTTGET
jgi:cyanophycinase-like exopeptidase